MPPSHDGSPLPERIGGYRVLRELGRGGMGVVFEAEQENPRRTVALKVLGVGILGDELRKRFEREAHLLGRLQHPCIAQVFEAGLFESAAGAQPYFAMELVRGVPLTTYADEHQLDRDARLELFARICDGVAHAHQRGVIHRDLKPGNILVDEEGCPKVLDFGLARATDVDLQTATLHTDVGQIMGTIPYMSPEQASGDPQAIDARSDVYALGVVAYELIAGRMPYEADGPMVLENLRVVREDEAAPLSSVHRDLRGDVETIVGKALEKDRGRRYPSVAELAADLRRHLRHEPIHARPPSVRYRVTKFVRRNRALVVGTSAVFAALVVGLIGTYRGFLRARDEAAKASAEAARAQRTADFFQTILSSVDPAVAQGSDTTLFKSLLDDTAERIGAELADVPPIEATLRDTMATAYFAISEFDAGLGEARRAAELFAKLQGPNGPDTLTVRRKIGTFLSKSGDYAQAEAVLRAGVADARAALGPDDPVTWDTRAELAVLLLSLGRADEAAAELESVLAFRTKALGPEDALTLIAQNALGLARLDQHRHAEGEAILRDVLAARLRVDGPTHPDTIRAVHNLGGALKRLQRFDEAEALYRESMEQNDRVLGPEHDASLAARSNLAVLLRNTGRPQEASELQEFVVETCRTRLGPEAPRTLDAEMNLALCYRELRRLEEAEGLLRHAYRGRVRLYGEEHPLTLPAMANLVKVLADNSELEEADAMRETCVELHRRVLGDEHENTLIARHDLGTHCLMNGDPSRAEPILSEVLATSRRVLGDDNAATLRTMYVLSSALKDLGRREESVALMGEFLDAWPRIFGDADSHGVTIAAELVKGIPRLERLTPAEPALRVLHAYHARTLGPDAPEVVQDELWLAEALVELERHDEAVEAFDLALERWDAGPLPARAAAAYGAALVMLERVDEGRDLLQAAWEDETDAGRKRRTAARLAEVFEIDGNEPAAAEWRDLATR